MYSENCGFPGVVPTFNIGGNNNNDAAMFAAMNNNQNQYWWPFLLLAWMFNGGGWGFGNGGFGRGGFGGGCGMPCFGVGQIAADALTANQVADIRNEVGRILSEVQCNSQTGRDICQAVQNFASAQGIANCNIQQAIATQGGSIQQALCNCCNTLQRDICSSTQTLSNAICAVQQNISNGVFNITNAIQQSQFATERGFCDIKSQMASCCCDLKTQLLDFRNGVNTGFAQIGFQSERNTANIIQAIKDEGSATRQLMTQQHCEDIIGQKDREIQLLRDERNANNLSSAANAIVTNNNAQTGNITAQITALANAISRIPTTTTPATTTPAA